ncbi:MAG: hypothetical protein QXF35_02045 [Candidatus Bilamarchaeaceae archaeon]
MCILSKEKEHLGKNGFIGKKMFNKDFVMSLSHLIATKYFPKKDDFLLFYDGEEAVYLAKRICICALQRGINVNNLEQLAKKANSVQSFNRSISKHFGQVVEGSKRPRPYINIYENEKKVLSEVFGLNDKEINDLIWGRLSSIRLDYVYSKIEEYAALFNKKLDNEKSTTDTIIKFLSLRWGLDDGFPKPIREISVKMGISDLTNEKIKKLMNEIFDGLLEQKRK